MESGKILPVCLFFASIYNYYLKSLEQVMMAYLLSVSKSREYPLATMAGLVTDLLVSSCPFRLVLGELTLRWAVLGSFINTRPLC